jgi:hypothetical protein
MKNIILLPCILALTLFCSASSVVAQKLVFSDEGLGWSIDVPRLYTVASEAESYETLGGEDSGLLPKLIFTEGEDQLFASFTIAIDAETAEEVNDFYTEGYIAEFESLGLTAKQTKSKVEISGTQFDKTSIVFLQGDTEAYFMDSYCAVIGGQAFLASLGFIDPNAAEPMEDAFLGSIFK